ncbi:PaaI family thioesterase [Pseudohalioglobus lutimaris]|uniref:PaaI family thioesterase n=1 Tax=Pseudohalioglobus lutimaris TaxID=1737061 RepID=A0A2N5X7X8_9GAMM|nr:PaaI family thioesterase [Pseudohalioglobus lutimaris]PLW70590.1 PaaI family thioesterase [Pseudohalioglobus lutimaris]
MNSQATIDALNSHALPFIAMLGGRVTGLDVEQQSCTFEFNVSREFCHSGDVVQGGFITAMLDAAMSHAVFGLGTDIANVSSLEITTRYLEASRAGRLVAVGKVTKEAYKTAFLEGALYDSEGKVLATSQSVAKLVRGKEGYSANPGA